MKMYSEKKQCYFDLEKNKDGNYYLIEQFEAPRGIKNKGQSKAKEVLIFGFHKDHLDRVKKDFGLVEVK